MGQKAFEKGTLIERSKDLYQRSVKFLDTFSLKSMLNKIANAKSTQMKVFLGFFFASIVYFLLIVTPSYSIIIGAVEISQCVEHEIISIWLIVMGSTVLFYFVVSFEKYSQKQ